jgi:outer membrane protein insertion porin family
LELTPQGDPDVFPVATANGFTSSITLSLAYDKRNDRFAPTDGVFASASTEYAGVGGDHHFTKGIFFARYYKEILWNIVWRNNLTYGFITPNESGQPVPFNELFLLGGANSLRGYDWFTIGKKVRSTLAFDNIFQQTGNYQLAQIGSNQPYGGTQQLFYNLEFQFPLIDEANIKGVIFYDIGEAEDAIIYNDLRSDIGFGFRWFSPIGPLRFEWGFPIKRQAEYGEQPVNFQFAIGAPF